MQNPVPPVHLSGHNGAIYDAAFHPTTGQWVTSGGDGVVARWDDHGTGQALMHHSEAFFSVAVVGNDVVAGTANGELMIRGMAGDPARWVTQSAGIFAILPLSEDAFMTGGGAGQIQHWQRLNGQWSPVHTSTVPDGSKVRTLVPSEAGIFVGTSSGWIGTLKDGQFHAFNLPESSGCYAALDLPERKAWLLARGNGQLQVVTHSGELVYGFAAHQGPVYRLVRAGEMIWSASRDKAIKGWQASDLAPREKITYKSGGHNRSVNALQVQRSAAGWRLLSGSDDRTARCFALNDLGCRATNPPAPPLVAPTTRSLG